MAQSGFLKTLSARLSDEPELRYLDAFLRDPRQGNKAQKDSRKLARDHIILERRNREWYRGTWDGLDKPREEHGEADGFAIVMNYLDPTTIISLGETMGIDAKVFRAHIDGCEQHNTGSWAPHSLTSTPYLRAHQRRSHFVTFDYRRRYMVNSPDDYSAFQNSRKARCTFLRSHHGAQSANALFEHERCTIAWATPEQGRPWGVILVLCDPGVRHLCSDVMVRRVADSIRKLSPSQEFNGTVVHAVEGLLDEVMALWNDVTFSADIQISALEDQLEHDFWDKPKNPVTILHEAQRLSRNLRRYYDQLLSMEGELAFSAKGDTSVQAVVDLKELKDRLKTLIGRTDRAVPALLASIAINEGSKVSSLTAVALWFAPLSLSVSIVSIDGKSRFGGKKYWIWACIALPLLLVVILVANSSDTFINNLGRRKRGRTLLAMFKPGTRIR